MSICDQLALLFATGKADHPTLRWFSSAMNEQNLVKLLRQLEQIRKTISVYIMDHLQRYIEHALYRLTKIRGCALW